MDTKNKRILVVEDDIQMSKFIQFKLNYLGYEVVAIARNSQDAFERASMLQPDLILMDIMLEGSDDGIATAQKIVAHQRVPIIYLTANEDEVLFERAKITEPFGYLIKPFNDRDLRIVLETSLYRHEQENRIHRALQDVRNILDSSLDMMITYDFEGHIIEFNRTAEELFGLKRSLAKRLPILSFVKEEDDAAVLLNKDPQAVYTCEKIAFIDADGNSIDRKVVVTPLRNNDGKILGRLMVSRSE